MANKTRTFEEIKEEGPKASARVEALRKAIADAEGLGDSSLVDSLKIQFNAMCDESASIMVDTFKLSFENHLEVIKAMEIQRKAAV
jgi:hypothetical protein